MGSLCLLLLIFLPAVLGTSHLSCNSDENACPIASSILSIRGAGVCEDSQIRSNVRAATMSDVTGYLSSDNLYFERLQRNFIGQHRLSPADSCAQILATFPANESGYYWVGGQRTYCNFNLQSPSSDSAWERISYVDMSDTKQTCPSNFRLVQPPETRGRFCVKRQVGYGCQSYTIPVGTAEISRVFGRIYGVHIGSTDGADAAGVIDEPYLDGVSITVGNPRNHVWSFLSYALESEAGCPCSTGSTRTLPQFIGDDYFCESGSLNGGYPAGSVFLDDLLWDGAQCGDLEASCCTGTSPPWFYKEFEAARSSSDFELRICTDQEVGDEDVGIHLIELYVQ